MLCRKSETIHDTQGHNSALLRFVGGGGRFLLRYNFQYRITFFTPLNASPIVVTDCGTFIVNLLQSLNAAFLILVTELGIVTEVKELHLKNANSLIVVTELGIVTEVKEMQRANANSPIVVTELGIVTEVKELQPANASFPIVVTELGIVTEVKETQRKNANSPIVVTEIGYRYRG